MANESKIEHNREILKNFLEIREIPKYFKAPYIPNERNPFGYIYCIENKLNGKKYIGSTYSIWVGIKNPEAISPIKKRASNYIYEYNSAINNSNKELRPIIQAMVQNKIENFIMYPIAETTRENHNEMEKAFIKSFNTIENGYNVKNEGRYMYKNNVKRILSESDKKLRSEPIVCINFNTKEIIFSDSMKLFADYMNTSKDMIKNITRRMSSYHGWFCFYIDPEKRKKVINIVETKKYSYVTARPISQKRFEFYSSINELLDIFLSDKTKTELSKFKILPDLCYKI